MNEIKPIETRYNGYRFRSRLEARWGVFFDSARIPYEYELEGFRLPSGACYLPDFLITLPSGIKRFVEIKPYIESFEQIRKVVEFSVYSEHVTTIISGTPGDQVLIDFSENKTIMIEALEDEENIKALTNEHGLQSFLNWFACDFAVSCDDEVSIIKKTKYGNTPLILAIKEAREARFEFGETPKGIRS